MPKRLRLETLGRRVRSIPYVCTDCNQPWERITTRRVVPPADCPFCGGRSVPKKKEEDDEPGP